MSQQELRPSAEERSSFFDGLVAWAIAACLNNKLLVGLAVVLALVWGVAVAPFDWQLGSLPRDPVATDAIPDIGENQQIVFTHRCHSGHW